MIFSPALKRKLFERSLTLHRAIARRYGKFIRVDTVGVKDYEPRSAVLELMAREIYRYNVTGSTAELGVYQGNFSRLINHYFPDRKLYLFDTFEGFDKRDVEFDRRENFSTENHDYFAQTSVDLVLSKMEHKENCIIRKGWFPDTAEGIDDKFCLVSLDADLYQPILAGLEFFYPRLVHGGVIMIHNFLPPDYNGEFCGVRKAVKKFCEKNNTGYVCLSDGCGSAVIVK